MYTCMQQLCTVCDMPITGEEADRNKEEAALFGTVPNYKVCCKCKQAVGDSTERDRKYQGRWRKHAGGPPPR